MTQGFRRPFGVPSEGGIQRKRQASRARFIVAAACQRLEDSLSIAATKVTADGVENAMTKKSKLTPKNAASKSVSLKSKSKTPISKSAAAAPSKKKAAPSSVTRSAAKPSAPAKPATTAKAVQKPAVKATAKPAQKAAAKPAAAPSPVAKPVVASKPLAAPVAKAAPAPVAKPVVPVARPSQAPVTAQRAMPANGAKPADARLTAPAAPASSTDTLDSNGKKQITSRHGFKTNELIVYPAHGVGKIIGIEEQEIAGISLELFVIEFDKDKMTLRVPTSKLTSVGMRKLAEDGVLKKAMETLKGKARIKRTMWSRRAQEYEAKINSGDLVAIAEVVRDLYRSDAQPEQSYSERQLYEAALDRMSRELAAVDRSDERGAMQRITEVLSKSARGRRALEEQTDADAADGAVKAA